MVASLLSAGRAALLEDLLVASEVDQVVVGVLTVLGVSYGASHGSPGVMLLRNLTVVVGSVKNGFLIFGRLIAMVACRLVLRMVRNRSAIREVHIRRLSLLLGSLVSAPSNPPIIILHFSKIARSSSLHKLVNFLISVLQPSRVVVPEVGLIEHIGLRLLFRPPSPLLDLWSLTVRNI